MSALAPACREAHMMLSFGLMALDAGSKHSSQRLYIDMYTYVSVQCSLHDMPPSAVQADVAPEI